MFQSWSSCFLVLAIRNFGCAMEPTAFTGGVGHGTPPSSGYNFDPQKEMAVLGNTQIGKNDASYAPASSSLEATTATQDYYGYASYRNPTNPYAYNNTEYPNYYYGYQQSPCVSSSHQVGANQNSGAPYQPLISFQNSASSVGPTSYSGTYYNTGDHQTMAGYQSNSYNNQNNMWNDGSFGSYNAQHYPSYGASCASSSQSSSSIPGNNPHLQYQYNQWPGYYNHPASSVSAPGTEGLSTNPPVHGVGGGYSYANNQPPPPGTTSWRRDSVSSAFPTIQVDFFE